MATTIWQKLGGMLLGVLALLGAILLVQWGYKKVTGGASVIGGLSAVESELQAPCTAAALPANVSGCGCPPSSEQAASRNDLFPGSYTTFGYSHVACEANPRNQRC